MKKYLMTGIAAVAMCAAFTSCSRDFDYEQMTPGQQVQEKYNRAFLNYLGVESIDPDQDWGFSATRGITRSNPGETYPQTEAYHNMNHNEWADPDKTFGGYKVPDPLTDAQKALVAAYFQSVPNLTYTDPHLRHFFVQQVYKGGKVDDGQVRNTIEGITAASGAKYDSGNMNLLSVGQANIHINDFNAGTCTVCEEVLDNGSTVNNGTYHSDQITLMVNIDDTSCFGYHETGSSTQHNNKAALVSWQTIRTWARQQGIYTEDILNDGWDRSFLGFDLAIKEGAQAQSDVAAKYNDGPDGNYNYAKIGGEIVSINGSSNILYNNQNIYYLNTNKNFYVAAEFKTINDADFIAEYRVNNDYKGKYINVDYLMSLINDGWLPVKDKNLREWVKVGKSDGYFSDWIVTLTNAEKQVDEQYDLMIIAEDLSASEAGDFDFNDVVLQVKYGTSTSPTKVKMTHAGGTLPLVITGADGVIDETFEVHDLFGVGRNQMVNTGWGPNCNPVIITDKGFNVSIANATEANTNLRLFVFKGGEWLEMKAPKGEPASKLAVDMDYEVLGERISIKTAYEDFVPWATRTGFKSKWWKD